MNKANAKEEKLLAELHQVSGVRWYHRLDWWWSCINMDNKVFGIAGVFLLALLIAVFIMGLVETY